MREDKKREEWMPELVLVRHGQSLWNRESRFTGTVDVPLTDAGRAEARRAAALLAGRDFAVGYTSRLRRAAETLNIIIAAGWPGLPVIADAALNERHYGDLQGRFKEEIKQRYGTDVYQLWHRSYEIPPPGGESLRQTVERVGGFYRRTVALDLRQGKNVLLVAHGNAIRSLVMILDDLAPEALADVEVLTGVPRVYRFDDELRLVHRELLAEGLTP